MKISTKGRYALRVMIDLAINSKEEFIPLKDIAKRQEISNKYLEQIIAMLNKAGFLETARGNMGGYKLSKKTSEYKVGDILRATEGSLTLVDCLEDEKYCSRKENCKTHSFWKKLDTVITDYVDSVTLEDLLS